MCVHHNCVAHKRLRTRPCITAMRWQSCPDRAICTTTHARLHQSPRSCNSCARLTTQQYMRRYYVGSDHILGESLELFFTCFWATTETPWCCPTDTTT